jgi:4-amino-4-deoxy-L-arabinose transferase-like glycosyltransferase
MISKNYSLLLFIILLVYCLFIETTMLRTTGDERVYISQALEMKANGYWFTQILGDQNNYYKGPLHYLLLQIGFIFFGEHSMWSLLYMNIIYLCVASYFISALVKKYYGKKEGIFAGLVFLLSAGVHAHTFSSQMEVEIICFFTLFLYLLDKSETEKNNFVSKALLWLVIGIVGWSKSPLYSALLTFSVLVFWLLKGSFKKQVLSTNTYLFLSFGIFIGVLGFMPAMFLDWDNFYTTYIEREHLGAKGSTGHSIFYSTYHFFINIFFPWGLFLVLSASKLAKDYFYKLNKISFAKIRKDNLLISLISLSIPSTIFFSLHPYRMANYLIVLVPVGAVLTTMLWQQKKYIRSVKIYQKTIIFLAGLIPLLTSAAYLWFGSTITHIPEWFLPSVWLLYALMIALHLYYQKDKWLWPLTMCPLFLSANLALCSFAKFEFHDLQTHLLKNKSQTYYYNLDHNIWNEWGLLNFLTGHKFLPIDKPEDFEKALADKQDIIFPDKKSLDVEIKKLKTSYPNLTVTEWTRWKTRGRTKRGKGVPVWMEALSQRDLTILSRKSYIVNF